MSRDASTALLDLHVHTRYLSVDSGLKPEDLGRAAAALGLSAVCVTEHNAVWPRAEADALQEQCGLPVLRGMEVSTDVGHVLTFGVESYALEMISVEKLRRIVESEGGAMVLAHPTRSPGFGRPWDDAPHLFEALECLNGDDYTPASDFLFGIAQRLGMPSTGGSDAHSLPAVGRCATHFACPITSERDLIAALRQGLVYPLLRSEPPMESGFYRPAASIRPPLGSLPTPP